MSIIDIVKQICMDEAERLPGAEIVAPLGVWDNTPGSIGVQIKAPKMMGPQSCEVVGNFTLSREELRQPNLIRIKALSAVSCMARDVQVHIRPLQKLKDVAPEALLGTKHAAD